ncbi:cytochrome P450 [Streptomyces sp. SID13031]|uniref:cytochrome P450 family protein n=1 Tax=Streptomyces sp. SID13031 TaxID=2706046 RepID=UPI0013CB9371|nr:cytochrome P450 [Streptomyces sp. SID13031]NEA32470.1 cytochrome P450 [Streptomyces sp. SID13031]
MADEAVQPDEAVQTIEELGEDFVQRQAHYLRRFRGEGPVHEVIFPHGAKVWLVTRYADCKALAMDPRVGKDGRRLNEMYAKHSTLSSPMHSTRTDEEEAEPGFDDDLAAHVLNSDPPNHTRLRKLAIKAVTPARQEALRPSVEVAVEKLLDKLAEAPVVDLLAEFAWPLPLGTICDLFAMPEEDRENFRKWSGTLTGAGQDPEEVASASKNMTEYANALIDARRADPGDDMISEMLRMDLDGDQLTQGEIVGMIFIVVTAGHVTTVHSIGNGVFNLLTHPEELEKLRADPSLIPAAVDELMRFDPAASVGTFRFTKAEIEIAGVTIPKEQILALSWGSANRDETKFEDPDRLDVNRCPQGTFSFGHGVHYCIGIPMAKMQIEIALERLLARYPHLRLAVPADDVRWTSSALLHGLAGLPVSVFPPDQV